MEEEMNSLPFPSVGRWTLRHWSEFDLGPPNSLFPPLTTRTSPYAEEISINKASSFKMFFLSVRQIAQLHLVFTSASGHCYSGSDGGGFGKKDLVGSSREWLWERRTERNQIRVRLSALPCTRLPASCSPSCHLLTVDSMETDRETEKVKENIAESKSQNDVWFS